MSCYHYLKDDVNKVLVCTGNHNDINKFIEEYTEYYKERTFIGEKCDSADFGDMNEKKFNELTLKDLKTLITYASVCNTLANLRIPIFALEYAYAVMDVCPDKIGDIIISENDLENEKEKYSDYKQIG